MSSSPQASRSPGRRRVCPAARGLTLVELLVTLTVASVLVVMAVPSFRGFMTNRAVGSATDDLMSALRQARSEALARGTNVVVCASASPNASTPACGGATNWKNGWLIYADLNADGAFNTGDQIIRVGSPSSQASLGGITENGNNASTSFRSNGLAAAGSRVYTITTNPTNNNNARRICVNTAGRIAMVKGAGAACPT